MATFNPGFTRPNVYVRQTSGQGAPALPPPFTAVFIGHGSSAMLKSINIVRGAGDDILELNRDVSAIVSITHKVLGTSYSRSASAGWTLLTGTGTASLSWAGTSPTQAPAEGDTYTVTYYALKRPVVDYAPRSYTNLQAQIDYSGVPSETGSDVLSGTTISNNISLAASIGVQQGMGQWWSAELDPVDESAVAVARTSGTSVSDAAPGTTTVGVVTLDVNLDGDGVRSISLETDLASGAAIAADIQAKVRALLSTNPAKQKAYSSFTAEYTTVYTLTSGSTGSSSSVVVSGGTGAVGLKLGVANGGTEAAGVPAYAALDLSQEAGLLTATQQALSRLFLVDGYALVPLFPIVQASDSGQDVNQSLMSVIKAHITAARAVIEQKWRVAIYGAQKNTDTGATPEVKYIDSATALGTDANVYVAPGTCSYVYGGNTFEIPGYGIASAVAGIIANPTYDPGEPISGKQLVGFSEIADPFNNTQKALMGAAGILMIDSELGTPAIIMDLTTDQSNAVNSQVKFTKSKDYVAKSLRVILRKLYINTRNLGPSTLSAIAGSVRMVLQQMVWLRILNDFNGLVVTRNQIDARQVDISVNIQLVPDVTWIYINLGITL